MAFRERLSGLMLMLAGIASLGIILWFLQHRSSIMPSPPMLPGVLRPAIPIVTPIDCLMPFTIIGATAMVYVGFKRMLFPDVYPPDR